VGGTVPLDQWTHIACTYDKQFARLYVNGVQVAVQTATQPIPAVSHELWIGNHERFIRQFDGLIDEVEIFSRALSASEIQSIVNAGSAGQCVYTFQGFFPPVDNLPTVNRVNAGRAIPVKFSLGGDEGLSIFAPGYPKSQAISCASSVTIDLIEETVTAAASALSYDAATDTYMYVWKTDKAWAGTCRQLIVKLKDNSEHWANFDFQ
jgi:Concanavalin A-like lectin/glucanases superfamily